MKKRVALLTAMANQTRLEILGLLVERELPVNEIAKMAGLSQSAVSQHLAKLRAENLVTTRRDAQTVYYSSQSPAVKTIFAALDEVFQDRIGRTFSNLA